MPRLLLINPSNSLVNMARTSPSRWSRYRAWKPLGLMVLAALTPGNWHTSIVDENLEVPDYQCLPRPDIVGITAFTSQANRAYEIAAHFRALGVPVVMGGIHATMRQEEAAERVDSVVTGEAEGVWGQVLRDVDQGRLLPLYEGGLADIDKVPPARHDLLPPKYALGAIQTTRGCPLSCSFCSVTAFNGARYRQRPIPAVVEEFKCIAEKRVFVVDDNLIGTAPAQISRAKELFRALAAANLGKKWVAQTTINFADDEELLELAAKAGCAGVFIGFESPTPEGLTEIGKRFNLSQAPTSNRPKRPDSSNRASAEPGAVQRAVKSPPSGFLAILPGRELSLTRTRAPSSSASFLHRPSLADASKSMASGEHWLVGGRITRQCHPARNCGQANVWSIYCTKKKTRLRYFHSGPPVLSTA